MCVKELAAIALSVVAAATAATRARLCLGGCAGTELGYGKSNRSEQAAGVIVVASGRALLVGHAVISRANEELCGTLNADDREQPQRDEQPCRAVGQYDIAVGRAAKLLGDVIDIAAAAVTAAALNPRSEQNRLDGLYLDHGIRGLAVVTVAGGAEAALGVGGEGDARSLTAKEDDLLLDDGQAVEALALAHTEASFKLYVNKIAYGNAVKTVVKGYLVKSNVCACHFGRACADGGCILENLLAISGQINACVFKAVAVSAAVKNSVGINTYSPPVIEAKTVSAGSVIRHDSFFS